jgi:hypothetical protein
VDKREALVDALAEYSGFRDPLHKLYRLRNPVGLKAFYPWQPKDDDGFRAFKRFVDGYTSLYYDLGVKCRGESNSGLRADSPLSELVKVFGMKEETTRYIVKFLRKALDDSTLSEETPLSFFVEE